LTRRAQQPQPVVSGGTVVATLRPRSVGRNDVLAYCDLPDFKSDAGKSFAKTTAINVYWSWFARTPEQIQDHLDHARYDVSLDSKDGENWKAVRTFDNWRNYQTGVVKQSAIRYYVYWFIPLDMLDTGQYRINYKLTWTQRISDGEKTFGPGGSEEVNTGSCIFTVK
jgi:hypothetical protein